MLIYKKQIMICENVHKHLIDIYVFEKNIWNKIYELPPNPSYFFSKGKKINKDSNNLYAICCRKCIEIYNDYKSNFRLDNENVFVSLFCNKSSIDNHRYNDIICFVFYEFNDSILFGTKNEIISFVTQKFYSLDSDYNKLEKKMNSTNTQNKKLIEKMEINLKKEKTKNEKMKKELENIEIEKNTLTNNLNNEKTEKEKVEKELENIKLEKDTLTNNLNKEKTEKEKIEKELKNIKKEKDILNNNLNKEKVLTNELNSRINKLNSEQNNLKNEVANQKSKLDKISFENNENIRKV